MDKDTDQYKPRRWNIVPEEGREVIQQWREKRLNEESSRNSIHDLFVCWLNFETVKGFVQNINSMVIVQIAVAIISVHLFTIFDVHFEIPVSLFVSPIVFPLAFSINADFQRREKVLDDLAVFKSHGMVWYFCMREWKKAADLDTLWITAVHGKLKSLLFHLCEYLLTSRPDHRNKILRAMYEDFSDANQLIEKIRASKLPSNSAIISRSVHLLNMMCLSFERLRVIREYRSPRSIRSFNKVFIMLLPVIFAPYFVHISVNSPCKWDSYYIAALVAFVFAALQCVQDKLDDPFDGVGEDNINLNTIDEWTFGSLEHAIKRSFDISRFKKFTTDWLKPPFKNNVRNKSTNNNSSNMPRTLSLIPMESKTENSIGEKSIQSNRITFKEIDTINKGYSHEKKEIKDIEIEKKSKSDVSENKDTRKLSPQIRAFNCNIDLSSLKDHNIDRKAHYHDDNCMPKACDVVLSKCLYEQKLSDLISDSSEEFQQTNDEIINIDCCTKMFNTTDGDDEVFSAVDIEDCFEPEYPGFYSRRHTIGPEYYEQTGDRESLHNNSFLSSTFNEISNNTNSKTKTLVESKKDSNFLTKFDIRSESIASTKTLNKETKTCQSSKSANSSAIMNSEKEPKRTKDSSIPIRNNQCIGDSTHDACSSKIELTHLINTKTTSNKSHNEKLKDNKPLSEEKEKQRPK